MNKYIFITRQIPETGLELLRQKGISFDIGKFKKPPTKKQLIEALKKKPYDGVISFLTDKLDGEVFDACPSAKFFCNFSVGFDNVDLEECKKRGIQISNTPGTSAVAVAEHTVALMLCLTTRIVEGDRFMRSGKYKGWDPDLLVGTDLRGKTIGLIGVGQIGTEVAKILHYGFGSRIIYSDIKPSIELERMDETEKLETSEVIKQSDILSLHVPLLPSTRHLINKESLATMKKDAFIVNTARGAVIDEKALIEALEKDVIKGAAIDVYEEEPYLSKGLTKLPDIVLTPHIASARISAREKMSEIAALNIISGLETGNVINNVIQS
jgi:glyoxylate reductase